MKVWVRGAIELIENARPAIPSQLEIFFKARKKIGASQGAKGRTEGDPLSDAEGWWGL